MNADGQLYTIEGMAASVLILTTVYLVLNTTMILTPGETHIYDMQLEQLGNDILGAMDLNQTWGTGSYKYPKSPLEKYIEAIDTNGGDLFKNEFLTLSNEVIVGNPDDIKFTANITYRDGSDVKTHFFSKTHDYNRERAVMVTRWVNVDGTLITDLDDRYQTVLLEVLLWRG